jgi:hypothetical protein
MAPLFLMVPAARAAGSASLYLSPASGTVVNGSNIAVAIYENSGSTQVNGVQANLNFNRSQLNVVSIADGSAWGIHPPNNGFNNSNGTVTYAAANISPLTGAQLVATVTFKAVASSGTAVVTFNGSSSAITAADGNGTNVWNGVTTGGSYTLKAPTVTPSPQPPSPPPPPPPPPSPGTKPSPSPSPTPTPPASGLQISAVAASDVGGNSATITWKTSAGANSQVDYGPDSGVYGATASNGDIVTDHKLVLQSSVIEPGVTYHYRVKSTDAAGHTALSADYTFTTQGAVVQVKVVDKDGQPVSGAEVSLTYATTLKGGEQSITGETDKDGLVTLRGFPVGKVNATVTYGGRKTNFKDLQVKPIDPKNPTQNLTFKISGQKNTSSLAILLPLLLLGVLAGLLIGRRHKNKDWHFPDLTPPASGGGGGSAAGTTLKSETTVIEPTTPPDNK